MPEPQLNWIKSSASLNAGACVEMAIDGNTVLVRHSRQPDVTIRYSRAEMDAFFTGVRASEFDHLIGIRHQASS